MENTEKKTEGKVKLVVVVRISGMIKVREDVAEALDRLRLRRKYACVVVDANNKSIAGMLKRVKHYIAFGKVDESKIMPIPWGSGNTFYDNENIYFLEEIHFLLIL